MKMNTETSLVGFPGTDAKIAKFVKKGIEIIDLAFIEPGEIRRGIPTHQQFNPLRPINSNISTHTPAHSDSMTSSTDIEADSRGGPSTWLKRMKNLGLGSKRSQLPQIAIDEAEGSEEPGLTSNDGALSSTGPSLGSGRRAEGYVWMIRRWLKPGVGPGEVLIEWRRGPKPKRARRRPNARQSVALVPSNGSFASPPASHRRHSTLVEGEAELADPNAPGSSTTQAEEEEAEEEAEEESDGEDSERPWHCELVIRSAHDQMIDPTPRPGRRTFLGTFTPQPHHPRLVGQLAVPWSLQPIDLSEEEEAAAPQERSTSAWLSLDELKDLIVISLMWLVVKEGLGGIGGQTRKSVKSSNLVGLGTGVGGGMGMVQRSNSVVKRVERKWPRLGKLV